MHVKRRFAEHLVHQMAVLCAPISIQDTHRKGLKQQVLVMMLGDTAGLRSSWA